MKPKVEYLMEFKDDDKWRPYAVETNGRRAISRMRRITKRQASAASPYRIIRREITETIVEEVHP